MMMQGDVEDATQIRRAVTRVMREFPQVRLAVSGDPQVYQMFDSISATRRFYLPPLDPEDYPYLLSQIDILLAPLNDNPSTTNVLTDGLWKPECAKFRGCFTLANIP
jgi:hypothetical protein